MKDIKSFLIGLLTCTCLFLIMGQTELSTCNVDGKVIIEENENGRYQGFYNANEFTNFMIDTTTGALYKQKYGKDYWEQWMEHNRIGE